VGLLLLAFNAWQQLRLMNRLTADWGQLSALLGLHLGGTPLGVEVRGFVACQLALHAGFGLAAWGLAWLTVRAFALPVAWRIRMLAAWFMADVLWLFVANATLFPWSVTGTPMELLRVPLFGGARLLELLSLLFCLAFIVVAVRAARSFGIRVTAARAVAYSLIAGLVLLLPYRLAEMREPAPSDASKPNLVLIGIDSLRNDVVGAGHAPGLTPNIDAFVRDEAQFFSDAITPLARTFPAWTSILTSRHPRSTGARENLIARDSLQPFVTLADVLRESGYHTVFATDEVRFSNIDRSFGFDQTITPTIGAADFLLGKANDLPLSNLVANTWLGRWMFPATYGNRAASVTYRPETFVEWLDDEIQPRGPTMLAIHLTLPHHPFTWSAPGDQIFGRASDTAYQYSNAVIAVDRQFGAVMGVLERKGLLRDALVVVLSDHGEALGLPESDALIRGETVRRLLDGQRISLWGHGSSVLSPHQFSAFLALRGYGAVDLPHSHREYETPVTLLDVAPTALDLLGVRRDAGFEGLSLRPLIGGDATADAALTARVRFTETGIRTARMVQGDFNERSLLGEAAAYFRMNAANGRFELRQEHMAVVLADKERAAMNKDWLLAAMPHRADAGMHKYLLVRRDGGAARRLQTAPTQDDVEAWPLWQALHQQYGDELKPPAPMTSPALATMD
jgi:arylsulfatase A-like enzyme